jgi:D-alanyl-lipoteichoic acid acyltransferase DltB (MBOAT superfamily)
LDGLDPENMICCIANNYSSGARDNLWIVRYLYIPLGSTRRLSPTGIPIFTFVAPLHDLTAVLSAWDWLAVLFIRV